ncbi:MAG: Ldh family oxidoreductase [Gammaproteobacteria bacterium]|nr:Ldh family oxidoreductase [Gammaproteobacteria bacterium]
MNDTVRLSLDEVHALALEALIANGFSRGQARAIADIVTAAERDLCGTHGLFRISFYLNALNNPEVNPTAVPVVTELAPAVVHVDGGFGFAPLALEIGTGPLVEKARTQGIAALCLNNIYHIAALWPEVERIAEQGLAAFAFTAALPYVAPAGGTKPLYGTNPMAFAWPRKDQPPMVFDQASSVSARGEIQVHLRDGKPIPEGWAIGPEGEATTDPEVALKGAQLAFGGHKGAAIALMVELLAGALVGDLFSFEAAEKDAGTGAPLGGEFLIAIDPARCVRDGDRDKQLKHGEKLFQQILAQPGTRLPSERRYAARRRTPAEGVCIPRSLHHSLVAFTRES